jgi:hypothetical protein
MAKSKLFHGPRRAYWTVTLPSKACSTHNSRRSANDDVAYHMGRTDLDGPIKVERTELCAYPGCWHGEVSTRKRGARFFTQGACPQCATHPSETIVEL